MIKSIYFAGPDVFDPHYDQHKNAIKKLCDANGVKPLLPADTEIHCDDPTLLAQLIYEQNIAYIRQADMVVANMKPFRGDEPDSGTVFEVGFAIAQAKPVWCYNVPAISLRERIKQSQPGRDMSGNIIEDFGLPVNLMIASSTHLFEGNVIDLLTNKLFK